MSTQTEITRIQTARNTLRAKAMNLGIVSQSTAKIDALATAFNGIAKVDAAPITLEEGKTYTIPAGYHSGGGTVSAVAGEGKYLKQDKIVTPTKEMQQVTADEGYFALASVQVNAIPEIYQDVSSVTAGAADVLANKVIVNKDGETIAGTMTNNGAVSKTLDASYNNQTYTVPKGYHSGSGSVEIVLEEKSATPTKGQQSITPTSGKVLSKVTVAPIPDAYITTTDADAVSADILNDKTAYVNGVKVTGSMPNNGAMTKTMDGLTLTSVTIPEGYTTGGTVSLTGDIEEALAAI